LFELLRQPWVVGVGGWACIPNIEDIFLNVREFFLAKEARDVEEFSDSTGRATRTIPSVAASKI
jgi:hypothetical protein